MAACGSHDMPETDGTAASGSGSPISVHAPSAATAFTVTTPASAVALDKKRQATVSFAVTNSSGRVLRAQALITHVAPPAAQPWLTLDGDPAHEFQVGDTQAYVVRIAV